MSTELKRAVDSYENFIQRKGISEDVINAYVEATKVALLTEKDRGYGLKVSARAKEITNQLIINLTGGTPWELEKFAFEHKTYYDILNTYYDILLCEAQNQVFDSYLLYLERKREPKERFYAPKRKQFHKFGLIEAYQGTIDDLFDIVCVSMPPGTGKALSMESKVLTPKGFVRNGDLKVGDRVIAANGKESTILGVYPQGIKPLYDVYFDDGSHCRCSADHLWTVQTRDDRNKSRSHKGKKYRTITLQEIMKNIYVEKGKRLNYSVDYVNKIEFEEKKYLIHPYVMGVLLGDGGLSQADIRLSTPDLEILEKVNSLLPDNYSFRHITKCDYGLRSNNKENVINKKLKEYNLKGKRSHEKFIPQEYMYGSYKQRLDLLRGLMDTDRYIGKSGNTPQYFTTSKALADGVTEIVHSLGGYASISVSKSGYKKDGKYVPCKDCYTVTIKFSSSMENIFTLKRKADRFHPKRATIKRYIKKVEYACDEECQCIYIDDKSHLYITDDYIITHNTTLLKFFNSAIIGWYPKDYNLFYSHSGDITRMYYDGVVQMVTDTDEYTWNDIFPNLKVTGTNAKMQQFNVGKYKPFPSLQTASVGSENAGKVRASKFLLVDDMIGKLEEALNKNTLDKQWGAYTVDARQRKTMDSNNRPCKEILNATRWSVGDVIGRVINMYQGNPRVKVVNMPATDSQGNSNFDYEYQGFTKEFFEDQQHLMDDISYKCLYMQQPIEREGLLFPEDKIRRYLNLPHGECEITTAQCDTKGKGTDYFVMPILEKYEDDWYCVDCVCDNTADYEMQYENAANVLVNNKVQECEFERNAGGDRVAMEVNKRVEAKGWICNITDVPTETNKEARIFQCSSWILQHVIFKDESLYTPKEPYGIMMSLLKQYSVSGKKQLDDVPDVFSNFALRVQKKERKRKTVIISSPI